MWRAQGRGWRVLHCFPGQRAPLLTDSLLLDTWGGLCWKYLSSCLRRCGGTRVGETIVKDSWLAPTSEYHISPIPHFKRGHSTDTGEF